MPSSSPRSFTASLSGSPRQTLTSQPSANFCATASANLPAFFSEDRLRADKRLAVRLGGDRDLLYLVYGPQPGRGRPIQEARRRGSPTGWR